ncbi:acyltransferase [Alteromonas sp. ASW11-19]|uniref:Acyltransferase n=1 Tax=Alteromonas salexigens TaxID=2982530 RepID=A0ABT2VU39_9ALTE|nr:acyltransferase [Alteromonas salexigens]MCU7555374.1 acyltransferase [Alteromonas salexigens]
MIEAIAEERKRTVNGRQMVKKMMIALSQLIVMPLVVPCKLEEWLSEGKAETVFGFSAQLVAMLPGMPGAFLRKAFYSLTLKSCSTDCHIGFGTLFAHRSSVIEQHVYIGTYAIIGSAHIGEYSLIGSRASIISRQTLHTMGSDGRWTSYSSDAVVPTTIAKNVWVGEGCTIAADIGEGSQISSGSVVTTDIKPGILVGGNPPRFIKNIDIPVAS